MRARELRERTVEELKNLKVEAKNKLFQARLKNATHQLTDSSQMTKNRREVARINTILKEREKTSEAQKEQE